MIGIGEFMYESSIIRKFKTLQGEPMIAAFCIDLSLIHSIRGHHRLEQRAQAMLGNTARGLHQRDHPLISLLM